MGSLCSKGAAGDLKKKGMKKPETENQVTTGASEQHQQPITLLWKTNQPTGGSDLTMAKSRTTSLDSAGAEMFEIEVLEAQEGLLG